MQPILTIAVTSSALFDMKESHNVFVQEGVERYSEYQQDNINKPLNCGVAFPFISRLLYLNTLVTDPSLPKLVHVVLFSRNSAETGLRAFNSIQHYGLDIRSACFTSGRENYQYLSAYGSDLFLSTNRDDVLGAIRANYAAGQVIDNNPRMPTEGDHELRIAFDFDGVISDDASERIFVREGLDSYNAHEASLADIPAELGPLAPLLQKISQIRLYETNLAAHNQKDKPYRPLLRTAIVTARTAPAHERVISTLRSMGVTIDEAHFMGDTQKKGVIEAMKPHIFFDDRIDNIIGIEGVPLVHIPFGIRNIE